MNRPSVNIIRNPKSPRKDADRNPDRRILVLRVTHDRNTRYYTAGGRTKLTEQEFNNKNLKMYKIAYEEVLPAYNAAIDIIKKLGENFNFPSFTQDYKRIVHKKISSVYDVRSVFAEYMSDTSNPRPISARTKGAYKTALNWLIKFKEKLTIEEITEDMIPKLDMFMRKHQPDISQNTVNAYFRCIKAVCNFAVDRGYIDDKKPFKKYSLTSTRRVNYGLSCESLKQILAYKSSDPKAEFGRDMFALSFLLNGHYLSDLLRLKNKNISKMEKNWMVQFIRHKTRRRSITVSIFFLDATMELIEKYGCMNPSHPNDYIFPFLNNAKTEEQINDRVHDINDRANIGLRIIAEDLGLPFITMAQARHTFATWSLEKGRSLADIQSDMGHANVETTQGYINTLRTISMIQCKELKEQLLKEVI